MSLIAHKLFPFAYTLPILSLGIVLSWLSACGPRKTVTSPTPSATEWSPASTQPVATAPTTPPANTFALPNISLPGLPSFGLPGIGTGNTTFGLPASPKQALVGRWNVVGVNGKGIPTTPGMATDPLDPATYAAGTTVLFTETNFTLERAGSTLVSRDYKVVSELPPLRLTIDIGNGPTNIDFAVDGSATWTMSMVPPISLSLKKSGN